MSTGHPLLVWITITTVICSSVASLLCVALGYLLIAGSIGADASLATFSIKASLNGFELNAWGFTPGLALAAFGCVLARSTVHRAIGTGKR